jgi:hypothetical protein
LGTPNEWTVFCTNVMFYNIWQNCEYFSISLPSLAKTMITVGTACRTRTGITMVFVQKLKGCPHRTQWLLGSGLPGRQVQFTDHRDHMEILKIACAEVLKFYVLQICVMYGTYWKCRSCVPWFEALTVMHIRIRCFLASAWWQVVKIHCHFGSLVSPVITLLELRCSGTNRTSWNEWIMTIWHHVTALSSIPGRDEIFLFTKTSKLPLELFVTSDLA